MPKSYTQANATVNHFLRNSVQTPAATIYLGLFTTAPSGPGDAGTEVSGGSYARVAVTLGAPASGVTSNTGLLTFTTASASWGTVAAVGLFASLSGSDLLYYANVSTPKLIDNLDTAKFAIGALQLTEQ
jgi:hypothetical protein